jgi:hypothetical protein
MWELFFDALFDTLKMVPLLLVIYIGIELVEYWYGNDLKEKIQKIGTAGPLVGATVGSLPQCGFSVMATALYTQRLITIGTLLAVYLATSDEAIPIILSQPDKAGILLPLILTKILIAIVAGYVIDWVFRKKNKKILAHINDYSHGVDDSHHHHELVVEEQACCGHCPNTSAKKFNPKEIFFHPIIHTVKIFIYILSISLVLNILIFYFGQEVFNKFLLSHSILQPFIAALIGLIPNCAASVAITQLYLSGAITYGSVVAGLCASGGLGLLVLAREEKNTRDVWTVVGLLFGISVAAGLVIQFLT